MEILIVEENPKLDDWYRNTLKEILGRAGKIQFCRDMLSAQSSIEVDAIKGQKHIDIIITDYLYRNYDHEITTNEFIEWLRKNENNYSQQNFKVSSIPIIVFSQPLEGEILLKKAKFIAHIVKETHEHRNVLTSIIQSEVKNWRRAVLDDLDILGIGIDASARHVKVGYTVQVKSYDTKVLSLQYALTQGRLPYSWLSKDFFELEQSIEELESLIKDYVSKTRSDLKRSNWEREFQKFFHLHPNFLFGETYAKFWSEPILKDSSGKKYKPDFIKQPLVYPEFGKNWQIVDLKTPAEEFMRQTDFHPSFNAKFYQHIKQVRDYYQYFNDDRNKDELESVLGFQPKNPRCTLIIGRRDKFYQHQNLITQNMNEINASFIELVTYDEIVEQQKVELEKMLTMRVF